MKKTIEAKFDGKVFVPKVDPALASGTDATVIVDAPQKTFWTGAEMNAWLRANPPDAETLAAIEEAERFVQEEFSKVDLSEW